MTKRKIFFLFILIAVLGSFASCSKEQEQKVDQQYLNSQDYSAFKENTDEELKNKGSENIADDLVDISDCSFIPNLEFPVSFDWDLLKKLKDKPDPCIIEKESKRLILIGEQTLPSQVVRWFLIENKSVYRDVELVVVTFEDEELLSFTTVGIYEKIPAHNIWTNITVERDRENAIMIHSKTIRDIKYPLQQKNTITAKYEIDANGGINEL